MSRILKRPMFRIGGSTNEGIVSMAVPKRAGYQDPTGAATTEDNYLNTQEYKDLLKSAKINAALMSAFAGSGRSQDERLSNLLIRGGLRTMSETPRGGIFATVSKAFEQPVDEYLKSGETEDSFQRQLRLAGLTQAMQSRENKAKLDLEREMLEEKKKEAALKLNPTKAPIYDILRSFEKKGIKTYEITSVIGSGDKMKPSPQAVANIPIGGVFHDPSNNLYLKVPKEKSSVGWVRLDRLGQEIVVQTPEKKPGFFEKYFSGVENYGDNMTDSSIGSMIKRLYTGPNLPAPTNQKITTNYNTGGSVEPVQYDPRSWNKQRFYEELAKKKSTME